MPKFLYKNISDQQLVIPNFGIVEAGKTLETDVPIDNPNLQLVKNTAKDKK